jgi:hypothetical protein
MTRTTTKRKSPHRVGLLFSAPTKRADSVVQHGLAQPLTLTSAGNLGLSVRVDCVDPSGDGNSVDSMETERTRRSTESKLFVLFGVFRIEPRSGGVMKSMVIDGYRI